MGIILGALSLLLGLVISVALHELGHMIPAKLFGVGVPQYSIGFGPSLGHRKWGKTVYHLRAIPLGGFVRIIGMIRPNPVIPGRGLIGSWGAQIAAESREQSREELAKYPDLKPMYELSPPKKIVVMAGGILTNLVLAIALTFGSLVGIGHQVPTTQIAEVSSCGAQKVHCPAAEAGIQSSDQVQSVAGTKVSSWAELARAVSSLPAGKPAEFEVLRKGEVQHLLVTPYQSQDRSLIGISPRFVRQSISFTEAADMVWLQARGTAGLVLHLPQVTWVRIQQMFGLQMENRDVPVSVVGIVQMGANIGSTDNPAVGLADRIGMLLLLLGSLNMALFIFNLIPLLPLDGGHVLSAIFEWARNGLRRLSHKPPLGAADVARLIPLSYAVGGLLLVMTVILVVADIVAPIV